MGHRSTTNQPPRLVAPLGNPDNRYGGGHSGSAVASYLNTTVEPMLANGRARRVVQETCTPPQQNYTNLQDGWPSTPATLTLAASLVRLLAAPLSTVPGMSHSLEGFNLAEPEVAQRDLLACCASRRWAGELIARRPYADLTILRRVSARVLGELAWADVEEALAAHPRVGERVAGEGQEAAWSREEQAGATSDEDLVAGNRAYEERFGHVFLICATGLSGADMLTALRARLGNDPDTERAVVRAELGKIVELRLGKAFS